MRWWLLLALLLPGVVSAQEGEEEVPETVAEEAPEAEVEAPEPLDIGAIEVLRDRTGGTFSVVRKLSREVEVIRAGTALPATPGLTVHPGDAIRTRDGLLAIQSAGGRRLEIAERSQVRLDPARATIRLGQLLVETPSTFTVTVGGADVLTRAGVILVRGDLQGLGVLQVLEGLAEVTEHGTTRTVAAGETTELGGDGAVRPLPPGEAEAVDARRQLDFVPPDPARSPVASKDRAHILLGGGIARIAREDFGVADLSARVRLAGPAWLHAAVGLIVRPADELAGYDAVLALPTRFGVRFMAELPRAVFIQGGGDFTLLFGARCTDLDGCPREFAVEPGGLLTLGVGLYVHERVGIQLELGGGLHRRRLPAPVGTSDEIIFPELQAQGLLSIFVRL